MSLRSESLASLTLRNTIFKAVERVSAHPHLLAAFTHAAGYDWMNADSQPTSF